MIYGSIYVVDERVGYESERFCWNSVETLAQAFEAFVFVLVSCLQPLRRPWRRTSLLWWR